MNGHVSPRPTRCGPFRSAVGGAATTGASVTMQTYFVSFQNLDFGEGYALSLLITAVTLLVSFVVLKLVYRPVEF